MIALLVLLLAAAPASAAEVHLKSRCDRYGNCEVRAIFTATPGERNALTAERPDPRTLVVRDTGAPVTPGPGCAAVDAHAARCTSEYPARPELQAGLGDGDDTAASDGAVDGGAGNDDLTADGGVATGGPGEDVLRATQRPSRFVDGDGSTPARDRYLGGTGVDEVSAHRRALRMRARALRRARRRPPDRQRPRPDAAARAAARRGRAAPAR